MTEEEILKEIQEISDFLTQEYHKLEAEELQQHLSVLHSYIARMPKLEAEAEYLLNYGKGTYADTAEKKMTATVFREKLAQATATRQKIYKYTYRLNKNIEIIHKGVITQLSYAKSKETSPGQEMILKEMMRMNGEITKLKNQLENKL